MRRLLKWLLITLGIAAIVRKLRARRRTDELSAEGAAAGDPADELRRKLAETREPEPPSSPIGDTTTQESVEDRRASVHDEGHAAIDEMRSSKDD